jgi:hypothetical protein
MEQSFANQAANPTQYNIEAISMLEHEALDRRTRYGARQRLDREIGRKVLAFS